MSAIGRLVDTRPREAWADEAQDFTPWLAENLDQLGEVVGLTLEAEGTEIAVGPFAADILAKDLEGDLVLIENQLERTDHRHMGQIMTYLAGVGATKVIWIATEFREEHLSAINWLNEHTVDPFAFFAIRLRVVRIGDSPPAPIFDVVARPNEWERRMHRVAREAAGPSSEAVQTTKAFWQDYMRRHPEDAELGFKETGSTNLWLPVDTPMPLVISVYRAKHAVGMFLRGPSGADPEDMKQTLAPCAEALQARLGAPMGGGPYGHFFGLERRSPREDAAAWPEAIAWIHDTVRSYRSAILEIVGEPAE